jgi:hypothetical protein
LKQKRIKKEQLKELFLSGKRDLNIKDIKEESKIKNKEEENETEKMVEIELCDGEIIKEKESVLKKYSNSVLASLFNSDINLPKKNGHIFLDRDSQSFKLFVYYLENNKLPEFKNNIEEKKFFEELNYWKIPIHISSRNILKFNAELCPHFFTLDKNCQILSKSNLNHGIVLLNKKLTALTPYIEFTIYLNNPNRIKKALLALVDENKIGNNDLNKSFESNVPFVFFWDLYRDKIVKPSYNYFNKVEFRSVQLNEFCRCYKNNYETKFGLMYNQQDHTVELIRDDVKLDILIQNIEPGLTPALEINIDNCRIQLSAKNKYQEKFYL